jgi:hypothetical protein
MAISIVSRGDRIFPLRVTCLTCDSVIEVENPRDLRVNTLGDSRITNPRREASLACPVCNNKINIDSDILNKVLFEYDHSVQWM